MPDTRALASLNRQTKADEDRKRWCIEQAIRCMPGASLSNPSPFDLIAGARKIEDYVTGRTTT